MSEDWPTFSGEELAEHDFDELDHDDADALSGIEDDETGASSTSMPKRDQWVRSLVECIAEVAPLFRASLDRNTGAETVAHYARELYSYVEHIADDLGLDSERLLDRYTTRRIALCLSGLVPALQREGVTAEALSRMVRAIHDVTVDPDHLLDMLSPEEPSSDILVNVRIGLLRPGIRFQRIIESLHFTEAERDKALAWLHQSATALAQDIAINWDRHTAMYDREYLFGSVIEQCAEVCIDAWVDHVIEQVSQPIASLSRQTILAHCPNLVDALKHNSMGYGDDPAYPISHLFDEMAGHIQDIFSRFIWESRTPDALTAAVRGYVLPRIENMSLYAWEDACRELADRVGNMSEAEFQQWSQSEEGRSPMPFRNFVRAFSHYESGLAQPLEGLRLEYKQIWRVAQSRLALIWGLSDAICALRE